MNAHELQNQIIHLITTFITNIPKMGQLDPFNRRVNKDLLPAIELANLNYHQNENDYSLQLSITLKNNFDDPEEEIDDHLQYKVDQLVQNFIDQFTKITGCAGLTKFSYKHIYQHPGCGSYLIYHKSDYNYYITYSQYLD